MSRIHEALARARAIAGTDGAPSLESSVIREDALPPIAPAEWIVNESVEGSRSVPSSGNGSIVEPSGQVSGSNGHELIRRWAFSPSLKEKLVVGDVVDGAALEQYRRLAAVLHLAQGERGAEKTKIVMISSSLSAEGKTLTCVNLALTLSESYHRNVLLVDGDLRRPWLHEVFQIPNVGGLNDSLTSREAKIRIRKVSENLSLLTAGPPALDPMRVLSSPRIERVLEHARNQFDWVLLDTPPVALLTDASLLASKADLVLLVIEAGKTNYEVAQRAVEAVGRERLVGVVLNRAQPPSPSVYAGTKYQPTNGSVTAQSER